MDFRRLLPEIRWQPRLSPGFARVLSPGSSGTLAGDKVEKNANQGY
jgi:hypothetical protein